MKRIGLAIVILGLGLVACSTPSDLASGPQLSSQFGTQYDDVRYSVATGQTSAVFSLFNFNDGTSGCNDWECWDYREYGQLTKYNASGNMAWQQNVMDESCYDYYCNRNKAESVIVDKNGYSYVLISSYYGSEPDGGPPYKSYYVRRYAPLGESVSYISLDTYYGYESNIRVSMALDSSGNLYVAGQNQGGGVNTLAKYSPGGSQVWRNETSVAPGYGSPTDMLISPGGSLYIAGTKGLSRYNTSGALVWTKAVGPLENVVVSGSNVYTRYRLDIRKFDANGKQLWLKSQSGLTSMVLQDISGDTSGNVYLSGKYAASSSNRNPFVRKLNSSGSTLWTKTYGTTSYDDASGIATLTGSDIYVTGETQGSLSHTNYGGRDGYLRKLNSSGNLVWSK